jgi:hypothetical protein
MLRNRDAEEDGHDECAGMACGSMHVVEINFSPSLGAMGTIFYLATLFM